MTVTDLEAPPRVVQQLPTPRRPKSARIHVDVQLVVLIGATVCLMAFFGAQRPVFFTSQNLLGILSQNAATFIVAAGAALLLMAGFIDMSVGSAMALAGVAAAFAFLEHGLVAGAAAGIAVGVAMGVFNGLLVGFAGLSPIVVTLGGLAAARGLAQFLSPGSLYGLPPEVLELGSGSFIGIPYLVWAAALVCVAFAFVSSRLPAGKHALAIGANQRAAFLSGVVVKRFVFLLYVAVGASVGVAAVLQVARLGSAPSGTLGIGFETAILTAVLLGGVPFTGGRGSVVGVVLGVWLIGVLNNGLTLMNVPPEASGIVTGLVLILAAASSLTATPRARELGRKAKDRFSALSRSFVPTNRTKGK
ncbi:MAG: ABC transporter permease [Bifidobacteriaceae bacterium]|jgi:ribose/xylose/arabinose/galactoside ABC-type transport system permease subunit|nr:ABC transporter permease [Bifidobacteriaceae bacterium]